MGILRAIELRKRGSVSGRDDCQDVAAAVGALAPEVKHKDIAKTFYAAWKAVNGAGG